MSMSFDELYDSATELAEATIEEAEQVTAGDLRLDERAFYKGWVTADCIIVHKSEDRLLQYYGGFEYVAKECRLELGSYVFYSQSDERVAGHLEYFFDKEEPSTDPEDIAAAKADRRNDEDKCNGMG